MDYAAGRIMQMIDTDTLQFEVGRAWAPAT
jgi:hypothetical protein